MAQESAIYTLKLETVGYAAIVILLGMVFGLQSPLDLLHPCWFQL
jgi:hypothetical protein